MGHFIRGFPVYAKNDVILHLKMAAKGEVVIFAAEIMRETM